MNIFRTYQQQLAASHQPIAQTALKHDVTQIKRILSNEHTPHTKAHKDSGPILGKLCFWVLLAMGRYQAALTLLAGAAPHNQPGTPLLVL